MKFKERLVKFLELQDKNMSFEDISKELKISQSTLRSFLNKRGYRCELGKYILKIEDSRDDIKQIAFGESITKKNESKKNNTASKQKNTKSKDNEKQVKEKKINTKSKPKKDRKINITQDDLDKLCEVYDWYLEVRDNKSIKYKNIKSSKKDIKIEHTKVEKLKSTSIRVDKDVWEDFERLCSNSKYSKQEVLTQALRDFMKEYKNLL